MHSSITALAVVPTQLGHTLVYPRLTMSSSHRNVYVSYDHPAFWTVFHRYRNNEAGCWLIAAQDLLFLQDASLSMPSLHLFLHYCPDSWYHSSFIFNSFRSLHTKSLHLFLGPWHALSLLPQLCTNNTFFGNLSSPILPKWPNHCNILSIIKSTKDQLISSLSLNIRDVILYCHCSKIYTHTFT